MRRRPHLLHRHRARRLPRDLVFDFREEADDVLDGQLSFDEPAEYRPPPRRT